MPGGPRCPAAIRADREGQPHAAQPTSPGRLASEREFISGHSTSGLDFNTLKTSRTQLADGICRPHLCARHLILAVLTSAILGRQLEEGGVGRPRYQGWAGGGAPTLVDVFSVQTWSTQLLTGGRKLLWGWRDREKYGQRGFWQCRFFFSWQILDAEGLSRLPAGRCGGWSPTLLLLCHHLGGPGRHPTHVVVSTPMFVVTPPLSSLSCNPGSRPTTHSDLTELRLTLAGPQSVLPASCRGVFFCTKRVLVPHTPSSPL